MPNCVLARQGLELREELGPSGCSCVWLGCVFEGGVEPFPSRFLSVSTVMEVSRPLELGFPDSQSPAVQMWAAVVPPLCLTLPAISYP